MNSYSNLIDDNFKIIINDMGTAPVVGAMIEVLRIPEAVNKLVGEPDPRTKVDTGTAIKALIINLLYGRDPLVHVEESFKHLDCEVLFGEGLKASDLNDDCLGKSLEVLGNQDIRQLYSKICMYAMELHSVLAKEIHVDTTNISVYGEYNSPQGKDFEVTYGDPKSKRKEFKQLNIGLFVQQDGFPVGGNALSGNKSDVIWFREALEELNEIFAGDIETMPICIFDAAGSNEEMFKKANVHSVPTIIRLSDRFNITEEHIDKAWEDGRWELVNKKGELLEIEPKKDFYKLRIFETSFDRFDWRLIVVYSSELEKLKESTAKRNYPKKKEKLDDMAKKLSKIKFETVDKANEAGRIFIEKNIKKSSPFKYEISVEESVTEKYSKRGKPSEKSEKTVCVKYLLKLNIGERDEELYAEWIKQESCFVLVSNVPQKRCSDKEIFREYKEQWVVEDKFRFLKQPVVLGPIWLQKQSRIKGLVFVLLLAVLVNMYICFRCAVALKGTLPDAYGNKSFKNKDNEIIVKEHNVDVEDENTHVQTILNQSLKPIYNQKILTTDGRSVEKPTYKVIKRLLEPLKTIFGLDKTGNQVRKFAYRTEGRTLDLILKIGFDPIIYLEKFSPHMDLWRYNRN